MQKLLPWLRNTLGPLFLMAFCPLIAIFMWYVNVNLQGSILALWKQFQTEGFFSVVARVWGPIFFGSSTAWKMILIFSSFQLLFMKLLPGKTIEGPITPKGNIPLYKGNGVPSFVLTLGLFFLS